MRRHRESPIKRRNPSGKEVWVARYTAMDGKRRSAGTFDRKHEAQTAIDNAYKAEEHVAPETLGAYAETWPDRHPRSERTNRTNTHRLSRVLDVEIEGRKLRDWPYRELRRRHAVDLIDVLLRDQGRAHAGAVGILRVLSAMTENAITDEVAENNAFKGLRVKKNDPRIRKPKRQARIYSFEEMHRFASFARAVVPINPRTDEPRENVQPRNYEALIRTITDTGRRLGEVLALERAQLADGVFHFEANAHEGIVTIGDTETKKHDAYVPATDELLALIAAMPVRIDTPLLYPTPDGKLWRERNFYRDVWEPVRRLSGMVITPHDCRHSWITHLSAAGVNEADLADMAGHSPETLRKVYRHALRRSFDDVRRVIG